MTLTFLEISACNTINTKMNILQKSLPCHFNYNVFDREKKKTNNRVIRWPYCILSHTRNLWIFKLNLLGNEKSFIPFQIFLFIFSRRIASCVVCLYNTHGYKKHTFPRIFIFIQSDLCFLSSFTYFTFTEFP